MCWECPVPAEVLVVRGPLSVAVLDGGINRAVYPLVADDQGTAALRARLNEAGAGVCGVLQRPSEVLNCQRAHQSHTELYPVLAIH
jgi:hypothetical protein